jgi:hypothetical protein
MEDAAADGPIQEKLQNEMDDVISDRSTRIRVSM